VDGGSVDAFEVRRESPVQLDRVHVRDALGEEAGQHAEPRPDLEHDVRALERGEALDHAQDVVVDEEVLAERFLRRHLHSPKTSSALATIWARIPSPCSEARKS
jgi:hypothetical protein